MMQQTRPLRSSRSSRSSDSTTTVVAHDGRNQSVYMLVVLGMALLAVSNNFTLLKQQGQSMLVKFEMELESTVPTVLGRANLFSPASSIPSSVSLPPTTYWHNNQTRVVRDIEYRRIPTWMKEYFDWHRLQTTTMNQTNWYHENRKYLILRCTRGEPCGGLSDRIKPMPGKFGLRFDSLTAQKLIKHTSFCFF